jgi:hypothetical protein
MKKVLFLDHDGVICLSNNWGGRFNAKSESKWDSVFDQFDWKALKVLNEIIEKTDCEIVVSSDWRFHATLEQMGEIYIERGILKKPIAYTDSFAPTMQTLEKTRSEEILDFVSKHPEIEKWAAVDDLNMKQWLGKNFVITPRSNEGIKQSGIKEKLIKILS